MSEKSKNEELKIEEQIIPSAETPENTEHLINETPELLISQLEEAFSSNNFEMFNQTINELKELMERLEQKAAYDYLTELYNREPFENITVNYINSIEGEKKYSEHRKDEFPYKTLSVISFDIDNFKKINDLYGHGFGDIILKEVASIIKSNIRDLDVAARWGGEEIVITLLGANEEEAVKKAEEIRQKIEQIAEKYLDQYPELKTTASIGVKEHESGLNFETFMKLTDEAMYEAKKSGKNKVVCYSEMIKDNNSENQL